MINSIIYPIISFYQNNIIGYLDWLSNNPIRLIAVIIDLSLVIFLGYKLLKIVKDTRAWQLLKGIIFLIVATAVSSILNLKILNYILTSFMTYGVLLLIVIFQPELRRALEQLRNKQNNKVFWYG